MLTALALSAAALLHCQSDGEDARAIMTLRQTGQFTQAQTLAIIYSNPDATPYQTELRTLLTQLAYTVPLRASDNLKNHEIQTFVDDTVNVCLKHIL